MAIFKLDNVIQNYAWGSKTSIKELFGIPNLDDQPRLRYGWALIRTAVPSSRSQISCYLN
ncbi:mannose-6-phosphate isomerase [Vibrio sp. JCM 19236]|nr:mannose-6-phosphate isomerase [Vibrio sp. JCM 19236]